MKQSHGRHGATTEPSGAVGGRDGDRTSGVNDGRPDGSDQWAEPFEHESHPPYEPDGQHEPGSNGGDSAANGSDLPHQPHLQHDHRRPDAVITEAQPSGSDQLRSREKRYATMMGIRVVCLIGAVLTFHIFWPIAVVFIVGMIVLPWCAVLIANDRPPIKPSLFQRYRGHPDPGRAIEAREHRVIDE